jgi:aminopeptidase N
MEMGLSFATSVITTLRDVIGNDSLWFTIFRTIQQRFHYQPVSTEDVVGVFNTVTGKDYTWFFDQYLRHAAIPVLALTFHSRATCFGWAISGRRMCPIFECP